MREDAGPSSRLSRMRRNVFARRVKTFEGSVVIGLEQRRIYVERSGFVETFDESRGVSGNHVMHNVTEDIGEPHVASGMPNRETRVVDAE